MIAFIKQIGGKKTRDTYQFLSKKCFLMEKGFNAASFS